MSLLALLALPAHAGVLVDATLSGGGSEPVPLLLDFDGAARAPTSTVFYDAAGNRWEVAVDVDDLDGQAFVAVNARVTDRRGRVVNRVTPGVLANDGKPATVRLGGGAVFALDFTLTDDGAPPPTATFERTFYAQDPTARAYRLAPEWTALSCEGDESLTVTLDGGAARMEVSGRFRPGDRREAACVATTAGGEVPVRVRAAFL